MASCFSCGCGDMLSSRIVILSAAAGNLVVMACTYLVRGWNDAGAHAAARNTARLSALWFAVAFAAPGLVRFFRSLPAPATLVHSFFAAHVVHFGAVVVLLMGFEFAHVSQHPGRAAVAVLGGFAIVLIMTLTATPGPSWTYTYLHRAALYAVFLIFFLVFVAHPIKPLRAVAVLLGVSLLLRLTAGMKFVSARMKTAS
jgi:hypothetical protein